MKKNSVASAKPQAPAIEYSRLNDKITPARAAPAANG